MRVLMEAGLKPEQLVRARIDRDASRLLLTVPWPPARIRRLKKTLTLLGASVRRFKPASRKPART